MDKAGRILIVDESRVVRATLAKYLREDFDVREEADGESAWQTLILDSSICAVVSGHGTARLNAHELLHRLRAKRLPRLQHLPVLMVVSSLDDPTARAADRAAGAHDFITKSMPRHEVVTRVRNAAGLYRRKRHGDAPEAKETPADGHLLSVSEIEGELARVLSPAPEAAPVCTLIFGVSARSGSEDGPPDVTHEISRRLAGLLRHKIGPEHRLGQGEDDRLVIVSRGLELAQCQRFAERVCRSLELAHVTLGRREIQVTISAGLACARRDAPRSGKELLQLARRRLDRASQTGGSAVVASD